MLREVTMAMFLDLHEKWYRGQVTQAQAASLLGVSTRTFRRYVVRYREAGLRGLDDGRRADHLQAPAEEVAALEALYRERYRDWNVKHFYEQYRGEHNGDRSYTWVKNCLQAASIVEKGWCTGPHREHPQRQPREGTMVHLVGWKHEWVPGRTWVVNATIDDATSRLYWGLFAEENGLWPSFRVVREMVATKGLADALYMDRESGYWNTPEARGRLDEGSRKQFVRAMKELGIKMIWSHLPSASARSERLLGTLQAHVPRELAREAITDIAGANEFLRSYRPKFNALFATEARDAADAFVPPESWYVAKLGDVFCLKRTQRVSSGNSVSYQGKELQIPRQRHRHYRARAEVRVHEYENGSLSVFHGSLALGRYDRNGRLVE